MTKRPARRSDTHMPHARGAPVLVGRRFPALTEFLRGYLHEDFAAEHGTAAAAAAVFCRDASPAERALLAGEIATLVAIAAALPVRRLRRFVTGDLGSAWEPGSLDEFADMLAVIRQAR